MSKNVKAISIDKIFFLFCSTSLLRVPISLGGFLLYIVIGSNYGTEKIGVFALAHSIITAFTTLGILGHSQSLIKFIGENENSLVRLCYLKHAIIRSLLVSLILFFICISLRVHIAVVFNMPELDGILKGLAFSIPPFVIVSLICGYLNGIRNPIAAATIDNGTIYLITAIILFLTNLLTEINFHYLGLLFFISTLLILVAGLILSKIFKFKCLFTNLDERIEVDKFKSSSSEFLLIDIGNYVFLYSSFIITGLFLTASDLGFLRVAERIVAQAALSVIALNLILPPRFARYFKNQRFDQLKELSCKGCGFALILSSPILLLIAIFPEYALLIFSEDYASNSEFLYVLIFAQCINIAFASSGHILAMSDNETTLRNIKILVGVTTALLQIPIIMRFGLAGAVTMVALSLLLLKIITVCFVRKKLGFWLLPKINLSLNIYDLYPKNQK